MFACRRNGGSRRKARMRTNGITDGSLASLRCARHFPHTTRTRWYTNDARVVRSSGNASMRCATTLDRCGHALALAALVAERLCFFETLRRSRRRSGVNMPMLVRALARVCCVGALGATACTPARAGEVERPRTEDRAVIVELFTSEGCSSCPPADASLADLEARQPARGALVVPLAFHVDYWDELGWKDPFSSPAWTRRQLGYRARGSNSLYTPQVLVDGETEVNGNSPQAVQSSIEQASRKPKAKITVTVDKRGGAAPTLTVTVGALPSGTKAADVMLAIVEPHARVTITSGENRGRTLDHTAVVRALSVLGAAPTEGTQLTKRVPELTAGARAVVFVQERTGRAIIGAAATRDDGP